MHRAILEFRADEAERAMIESSKNARFIAHEDDEDDAEPDQHA